MHDIHQHDNHQAPQHHCHHLTNMLMTQILDLIFDTIMRNSAQKGLPADQNS